MEHDWVEKEATSSSRPLVLDSIVVRYEDDKRVISCFCGQEVIRSIVPHMKRDHSITWAQWVQHFVHLRSLGFPLKKIMRLYRAGNGPLLFSWTVVEREVRKAIESGSSVFTPAPSKKVDRWGPDEFELASGTIWDFPKRGDWAVHTSDYRGNWPPQLVRNLILRFTEPRDLIIDAFVGGGTTLIEAWLCGRKSVGVDISRLALQITGSKLDNMQNLAHKDSRVCLSDELRPLVVNGDALQLVALVGQYGIEAGTVKLVCAHPPYLDSLRFTLSNERDLSLIKDPEVFYKKLCKFAGDAFSILETNGICALLIGDVRKAGQFVPLGFNSALMFQKQGFYLDSIVIKPQNWDRSTEFYRNQSFSSLLLEHEYLFIFRRPAS